MDWIRATSTGKLVVQRKYEILVLMSEIAYGFGDATATCGRWMRRGCEFVSPFQGEMHARVVVKVIQSHA